MCNSYKTIKHTIEKLISKLMLIITVIFLSILAILIQYLQTDHGFERLYHAQSMVNILEVLWLILGIERILYLLFCYEKTGKNLLLTIIIILIPPLRLASRKCNKPDYIFWNLEWQLVDEKLYTNIEKRFLYPIFVILFFMIPFWIIEIFSIDFSNLWLFHLLNIGNAIVWSLFVIEFIILCSICKKPLKYALAHWLELSIIILPMLALARFVLILKYIQVSETTYLIWFIKIQKILNIYRTRSVIHRIIRILTIINIVKRFYQHKNPQKYLEILEEQLQDKEQEIAKIKQQIKETKTLNK